MRKYIFLLILCFVINLFSLPNLELSQSYAEDDDAFLAILALNYCQMSLFKITQYNDRVVLDEEYNNIINNINLSKIKDPEIVGILLKLMDVLAEFKLDERSKEQFLKQYEKNVENALYSSLSDGLKGAVAGAASGAVSGAKLGPHAAAAKASAEALAGIGCAYFNYRNAIKEYREALDEAVWKLEDNATMRIKDMDKVLFATSWNFITKYKAPDKWRLTREQFQDYFAIIKDKDDARKYRNLGRLENELTFFPPYWYFMGEASQKIGKREDVLNCYAMYKKVRKGFFRQDKTYSSVIMLKVVETDYINNQKELFIDLEAITDQDKKDWRKKLFCAYKLIQYGELEKAREQVQTNIDNGMAVSLSRKVLADIYCLKNDTAQLTKLIERTIDDNAATNQEVLYLIGKLPAEKMIEKIKDQILSIKAETDTHLLGKDDLILHIPQKWILDDPENLTMKLLVNEKEHSPKDLKADKERKEMTFTFEGVLDEKELLEGERSLPMAFSLNTQAGSVYFLTEMKPTVVLVDKGYTDKGVDLAKSATGGLLKYVNKKEEKPLDSTDDGKTEDKNPEDKKEEKVLKFVLNKIKYLDACFQISADQQIEKCQNGEAAENKE